MRGVFIEAYGGIDVLQFSKDLPKPTLKTDTDVLLEIHAASLNPIDYKLRDGLLRIVKLYEFPLIMGHDMSGIVLEVGDKVTNFKKGDEVFARVQGNRIGTLAEYIVSDQKFIAKKPENITHIEAASIPLVGMTTLQAFEKANLKPKSKVLILGGSGGTGTFAIQLAKHVLDLYVIVTCSSKNEEFCKSLGADETIDYKKEDFTKKLSKVDFVFDTTGEAEKSFEVLKKYGKCYTIAAMPDSSITQSQETDAYFFVPTLLDVLSAKTRFLAYMNSIDYQYISLVPNGNDLEKIGKYINEGKIKPVVDSVFDLENSKEAFQKIESVMSESTIASVISF
eukprot:gene3307-5748_t